MTEVGGDWLISHPFAITVYDAAMVKRGTVGNPITVRVTPRHNTPGSCTLVIASTHPRAADLFAEGARVRVTYSGTDAAGNHWSERLISGPVRLVSGKGPKQAGELTFQVEDDTRLLWRVLGWPNPAGAITAQGAASAYDTRTGAAETVLKGFVSANAVARLGLPVVCATDLGRGSAITVDVRMHPLADRLLPALTQAGIGFTVDQQLSGGVQKLVVDCYVPATYPRTLTEEGGVVTAWEYVRAAPTATRVVVAAQGVGTARGFTLTADTAREALWGDVIEVTRDARDTSDAAKLAGRAAETLAEGAATSGVRVELSETGSFRYGGPNGVHVGDLVSLVVGPSITITAVLLEATLNYTVDSGLTVTPTVGELDNPLRTLAKAVQAALRRTRDLSVSQ